MQTTGTATYPQYQQPAPRIRVADIKAAAEAAGLNFPLHVQIAGRVTFSHILTKIDGKELEEANARKTKNKGIPDTKPYYSINIGDACIFCDPSYPAEIRTYFEQRISHKSHPDGSMSHVYYGRSNSPLPIPIIWEEGSGLKGKPDAPKNAGELPNEFGKGLNVILNISIFKTKSTGTVGTGIDEIIVDEPPIYFEPSRVGNGESRSDISGVLQQMRAVRQPQQQAQQPMQGQTQQAQGGPVNPQTANPMGQAMAGMTGGQPQYGQPNGFINPPEGDPATGGAPTNPGMQYQRS